MGFAGRLEGIAPSDIFQIISQSKMTGTLIARCSDRTAMVVFNDGQVVEAASDSPLESLGHLLISRGLVSKDVIEAARKHWKREPDRTLGAVLVEMGAIDEKALEAEVRRQIGAIVHRLMSCDDGFITFDRGERAVKRKLHTREFLLSSGVSPEFLIMERARVIDEERRSGIDRRTQKPTQTSEGVWDGRERRRANIAAASAQAAGFGASPRGLGRSAAAAVQSAAETAVRIAREFTGNAVDRVRKDLVPWLGAVVNRVRSFSPDGRAMVFAGIGTLVAGIAIILLSSVSLQKTQDDAMVIGRVVNVRANPTTDAKTIAKVVRGEAISLVSTKEGWHKVRTRAGDTGWVWHKLVERKETSGTALVYGWIGCGLLLLAGAALLAVGIIRKRRAAPAAGQS
jgi:hypothetical protein